MKKVLPVIAIVCSSLVVSGCANKTMTSAAIGAAAGAVAGKSTGNHKDKRLWIGAAIGALAGAAVGQYMDRQEAEFRQELSGSGIDIVREGNDIRLVMPSGITFAPNQSSISPSFDASLDDIAAVMKKYDKTFLSIEGHTDSSGNAQDNMLLSEQRAQSVKSYLQRQGVSGPRMIVVGYGATQPIASNNTSAGRAQNRRVEITIIPNQE